MTPNLGIADSNREHIVKILNDLLADEYVLYTKTREEVFKRRFRL